MLPPHPPHDTYERNKPDAAKADSLARQAIRTIERHGMLNTGDKVLVGVSAGPDSVVLLHLLHNLAERLSIRLGIAHLDHGRRPEAADAERDLVIALGRRFGLECHLGKLDAFDKHGSLEEQLRKRRYAFFKRTASAHGYNRLALGHHADDNAEAVLLHLLRGSGLRGLSGIPPIREEWIVRPLIGTRRAEILAYAERHHLTYLQDASNLDPRFERNKIRHQLIPFLESHYNPNLVDTLNRTAALCREEEQWQTAHAASMAERITHHSDSKKLELRIAPLRSAPRALQRHLIRSALGQWQGHLKRIGAGHIDALLALLAPEGRKERRIHLPSNVVAEATENLYRFRRVADLRHDRPAAQANYCYTISDLGQENFQLLIPEAGSLLRFSFPACPLPPDSWRVPEEKMLLLDMDCLTFPLTVRNFIPGDHFEPFGLDGRQKLKKLFIDRKVPQPQRQRIPLLTSAGSILWVVGIRRGRQAAVTSATVRVLCVEAENF
jgi:tRNA(Ile)-lysidine synthase